VEHDDDLDLLLGIEPSERPYILDLCSGTGSWSAPYRDSGYQVIEVTWPSGDARLWPSLPSNTPRWTNEYFDVREWIGKIHGILAGPPCTMFSNAGNAHQRTDEQMLEALSVVDACVRLAYVLKPKWWVLENPLGKINKWLGNAVYSFDPCDFGDPYTKKTFLWGRFNPPVKGNYIFPTEGSKMHKVVRNVTKRSMTPQGFAKAFYEANP
jgi:hypothetical protein